MLGSLIVMNHRIGRGSRSQTYATAVRTYSTKSAGVLSSSHGSLPSHAGCTKWCSVTTGSNPCAWQLAIIDT